MIGAYDCVRFIALGAQANGDAEHQILLGSLILLPGPHSGYVPALYDHSFLPEQPFLPGFVSRSKSTLGVNYSPPREPCILF